jgi:probable O-glycosylation ligase (exosortase A-associated)
MLRNVFVFAIITVGVFYATQGPFYALLFYLWNAYFRPEQWVWGDAVGSLNLSFIIGVYLVGTAALSARDLRINFRTGLLLLFAVQTLLSTVLSEHVDTSLSSWLEFSKVLLVSYLIVVLLTDRSRFRTALLVIALSLGFECAKQGWAQLVLNPGAQNNNPIAFLGDNNGVAVGTMMLVPIFSALAQTATRRWEANLHRFFLIGVFLRGFTTYSRGGFLAAAILGLLSLVRSQHKFRALLSVTVIVVLVGSVMPDRFWDRMATIVAPSEERDASALGRLHFWSVAVRMATQNPIEGVGFNGYKDSYDRYDTTEGAFGGERQSHSVWLGLLAETGFPGLFLFVTIWIASVWSCIRVRGRLKRDPAQRELAIYAVAMEKSLVVYAVAGTFLALQYNEMAWHFFGLTTALHVIATSEAAVTETPAEEPAPIAAALRPLSRV